MKPPPRKKPDAPQKRRPAAKPRPTPKVRPFAKGRTAVRPPEDQFEKVVWKPGNLLNPTPVVLVSCADAKGAINVTTVAWAGTVCSEPPMLSISLRPTSRSHEIIAMSGEFVVNVPSVDLVEAVDYCGVASGHELDKFERTGLRTGPSTKVGAPLIQQCPINMECQTRQKLDLGSHTLFLAEIVAVHAAKEHINDKGRFVIERADLLAYAHGHYYGLGERVGFYGFSVEKRARKPQPAAKGRRRRG